MCSHSHPCVPSTHTCACSDPHLCPQQPMPSPENHTPVSSSLHLCPQSILWAPAGPHMSLQPHTPVSLVAHACFSMTHSWASRGQRLTTLPPQPLSVHQADGVWALRGTPKVGDYGSHLCLLLGTALGVQSCLTWKGPGDSVPHCTKLMVESAGVPGPCPYLKAWCGSCPGLRGPHPCPAPLQRCPLCIMCPGCLVCRCRA